MELTSPSTMSLRCHWPMQGPQALASTVPPRRLKVSSWPSRSMVASICSDPGVTQRVDFGGRAVGDGLFGDVGGARQILVGGIRAGTDEAGGQVGRDNRSR